MTVRARGRHVIARLCSALFGAIVICQSAGELCGDAI